MAVVVWGDAVTVDVCAEAVTVSVRGDAVTVSVFVTVFVVAVTFVLVEPEAIVASLDVFEVVLSDLCVSVVVGVAVPLAAAAVVVPLLVGTGVASAFF